MSSIQNIQHLKRLELKQATHSIGHDKVHTRLSLAGVVQHKTLKLFQVLWVEDVTITFCTTFTYTHAQPSNVLNQICIISRLQLLLIITKLLSVNNVAHLILVHPSYSIQDRQDTHLTAYFPGQPR